MVEVASCHPFMPLETWRLLLAWKTSTSFRCPHAWRRLGWKPTSRVASWLLSEQNKGNRLLFAQEAIDRHPPEFWKSVVFTDEKIFRTDLTGRVRVRRPRGARHEERFTVTKDSSGRESVHCWAWIDGHGNGELHRIEGRHTAGSYVAVLEDVLLPTLQAMRPGEEPYVLQQDNAPQHTARVTKAWLADHQEEINVWRGFVGVFPFRSNIVLFRSVWGRSVTGEHIGLCITGWDSRFRRCKKGSQEAIIWAGLGCHALSLPPSSPKVALPLF